MSYNSLLFSIIIFITILMIIIISDTHDYEDRLLIMSLKYSMTITVQYE